MNNARFDLKKPHCQKRKSAIMETLTSKNKLKNNANYNEKCSRKTVIFRPQDKNLYVQINELEKGQFSELVRDLLKRHFDKANGKSDTD